MLIQEEKPTLRGYQKAKWFTNMLKKSSFLTPQQKKTLYGQAVHGDLEGAWKGYETLMKGNA